MALNRKLSDKPLASSYSETARVHIYEPDDLSQAPTGSDYQMPASYLRDVTATHFKDDYSIVSNTPILSNSTGKLGDEYRCTDAGTRDFGSGNITLGIDDILAHNGSVWFKKVDNNQGGGSGSVPDTRELTINGVTYDLSADRTWTVSSGVTQTKKTITSANLSTQNMTGFLTYVNGVTSFAIASNEIVEYLVTDTGQIFKLMVNNRSVGSGETALTSTDVLEIEFPQETILQNIGVWVKFHQASANAYPFTGGALNSGTIQGSKTANTNEYSNSHITLNATNGVANSGARWSDGNAFPTTPFKGVTFFAVICPIVTTNLSAIIGMPGGSSLTTITENTNQGIWFNITGNQLQAKCAYASTVSTGTAVTITATEWLLCMIEVIDNDAVNKRVRFKVKKTDGTVVYNQDITTNIQPYNIFSGNSSTGCRAVLTSTAVGNTDILGLQAMGFWMNKPNFLRNF
jgi:hypothetical protein